MFQPLPRSCERPGPQKHQVWGPWTKGQGTEGASHGSLGPSRGFLGQEKEEGRSRQREQKVQTEAQESQGSWEGCRPCGLREAQSRSHRARSPPGWQPEVAQLAQSGCSGGTSSVGRKGRPEEEMGSRGGELLPASPRFSPVPKPGAGEGPPAGEMQPASPLPWRPGSSSQLLWGDGPPSPPQPGQG